MIALSAARRIPRVRWGIGVLLGTGVLINYFDRINLSVGRTWLRITSSSRCTSAS